MIYYGARSSLYYFHQLECVRRSSEPHEIVSVIGGMAWIHAIGPQLKSLTLIDIYPGTVALCRSVLKALQDFKNLADFKTWVSKYASCPTTHLDGHGMDKGHFYWHFGQYNFASQEHYDDMRYHLSDTPVTVKQGGLEQVDYASMHSLFVLVSNADGANGFNGDKILPRVLATARNKTTYVNWLHRITIEPNQHKVNYDDHRDL